MNYTIQKYVPNGPLEATGLYWNKVSNADLIKTVKNYIKKTKHNYKKVLQNKDIVANSIVAMWNADCKWKRSSGITIEQNRIRYIEWEISRSLKFKPMKNLKYSSQSYCSNVESLLDSQQILAFFQQTLDKTENSILYDHYISGLSPSDIASKHNIKQDKIYGIIKQAVLLAKTKFCSSRNF